jgi:putative ABC transport system permease protein
MSVRPPALAIRLLRACVGATAFDVIAGDLDEGFSHGRGAAWYWRQTLRSIGAHWAGLIPVAGEVLAASIRQLARQPLYVAGVAGTLALAVATAVASGAVLKRAFIDALPYPHADRLTVLTTDGFPSVSAHVLRELREGAPPFDGLAPTRGATVTLATEGSTTSVNGMLVTPEYFDLTGTRPVMGRVWTSPEEPAVIVSWPFFERELAGDPAALDRPITIDGVARTVVGVMPAGFLPPYWPTHELWLPLNLRALEAEPRARRQLTVLARVAAGESLEGANAWLTGLTGRLRAAFPVEHGRQSWSATPLREELMSTSRPALIGVAAGAVLLLLIVCANIGGLATARAAGLQQQVSVRRALGGSGGRLFAEQFTDAFAVSALGTALGLALSPSLVAIAVRYQRDFLERVTPFALDAPLVASGALIGLVVGTVAALLPVRAIARGPLSGLVRSARGAAGSRRLTRARQALVIAQVALALVLVVGAGLLVRTVQHLTNRPFGFSTEGMTTMAVTMPGKRFASQAEQVRLEEAVLSHLTRVPGVTNVTASVGLPASRAMGASLHIRGRSVADGLQEVGYNSIAPGFIDMMRIPLKAGRDISVEDRAGSTGAILLNESMARQYWPDGDAIGARIYLGPGAPEPREWMEVVGIIGDVRPYAPGEVVTPSAYGSTRQYSWPRRFFTVHTARKPGTLEADMRAAVRAADASVSVGILRDLPELADAQRGRHRLVMTTLAVFAGVALVLCASGLYAVAAMMSGLRRREYAIRVALGAPHEHVRWHVVRQAVTLAAAGIIMGLAIAAGGVRAIQGLLHGVGSIDPATFAGSAVMLALIAAAAAWWPARQAARVDPVETLKTE